jgi:hypothetical protein
LSLLLHNRAAGHEGVWWIGGITPSFLASAQDRVSGHLHAPATLLLGKIFPLQYDRSLNLDAEEQRETVSLEGQAVDVAITTGFSVNTRSQTKSYRSIEFTYL